MSTGRDERHDGSQRHAVLRRGRGARRLRLCRAGAGHTQVQAVAARGGAGGPARSAPAAAHHAQALADPGGRGLSAPLPGHARCGPGRRRHRGRGADRAARHHPRELPRHPGPDRAGRTHAPVPAALPAGACGDAGDQPAREPSGGGHRRGAARAPQPGGQRLHGRQAAGCGAPDPRGQPGAAGAPGHAACTGRPAAPGQHVHVGGGWPVQPAAGRPRRPRATPAAAAALRGG
ncbi:MAG: hypothetical protein GAK34_03870 [Delftia tsuruhatensis]|nr:MAG: hypothetical protein GAK34_03870 [Delftia tsuruhatensis]